MFRIKLITQQYMDKINNASCKLGRKSYTILKRFLVGCISSYSKLKNGGLHPVKMNISICTLKKPLLKSI